MKTLLKPNSKVDPHVLKVFSNAGDTYIYGVFDSRQSAIEFGDKECSGFRYEAQSLIVVDRS